ncbi:MAG: polyprenyl synthetase family protein [Planctomycetes bacterium]|nr:polyprenyl synthetase family protein [Planctomycetota bacterium]MCW8134856.1 polyprenyl synthetase family protein [Planctomycetota bacterium]
MQPLVDQALKRYAWPNAAAPRRIIDAMNYSLNAGGKRLRPLLVFAACEAVDGDMQDAMPVAAAFEFVHTYSLIHDDLPAMDDDDLRRGQPTCHKAFDEATAILAGDAMNTYAFQAILEGVGAPARAVAAALELARASGIEGMVGGQMADLESEGQQPDLERLRYIHSSKTGALITAACVCGGIVGGAHGKTLVSLRRYGQQVGLAFQVVDDILDETATAEQLGKSPGKDAAANKMTYPRVMGLEAARQHASELVESALGELEGLENPAALRTIAAFFTARTH